MTPYVCANNNVMASSFQIDTFFIHTFSASVVDQAQDTNNAVIKGDGGAIGLSE